MRKKRTVKVSYEINRLAETHLFTAYEKLIPTVKKQVKSKSVIENLELILNPQELKENLK